MNEILVTSPEEVVIKTENLPDVITDTFSMITNAEEQIKKSLQDAEKAKTSAMDSAEKNAGWSLTGEKKRIAIESLQTAVVDIVSAQESMTDAMEQSFKGQEKIAKAIRYLFGLGISNIAANRMVVRQLELKLRNASAEERDSLAMQELEGVVRQLKAQEDLYNRLENQKEAILDLEDKIKNQDSVITAIKEDCAAELLSLSTLADDISATQKQLKETFAAQDKAVHESLKRLENATNAHIVDFKRQLGNELSILKHQHELAEAEMKTMYEKKISELDTKYTQMISAQNKSMQEQIYKMRIKSWCNTNAFILATMIIAIINLVMGVISLG